MSLKLNLELDYGYYVFQILKRHDVLRKCDSLSRVTIGHIFKAHQSAKMLATQVLL